MGSEAAEAAFSGKIYFAFDRVAVESEYGPVVETAAAVATAKRLMVKLLATCESPCGGDESRASALRLQAVSAALVGLGVPEHCIGGESGVRHEVAVDDEDSRAEARSVRVVVGESGAECVGP
jgi:hypothetical protein